MGNTPKNTSGLPWYGKPGGILFIQWLRTVLAGFILGPVAVAVVLAAVPFIFVAMPLAFLAGCGFGALSATGRAMPPGAAGRYVLPLCFAWVMLPAFFPFIFIGAFNGASLTAFRFLPAVYMLGLLAGFVARERRRPDKVRFTVAGWVVFIVLAILPLVFIGRGVWQDAVHAAKRGHGFERVGGFSSTDLKPYDPRVPGAVTARLEGASSFVIRGADNLPVLDGAEAAFPVYAAFAAACYPDMPPLSDEGVRSYDYRGLEEGPLRFTNTIHGFRRLVYSDVDIFFGARPSESHMRWAAANKKELVLTPIGREAFVFFVNEANPVSGLSSQQIRNIYSGKVRQWKEVGGADADIMAFQRPNDSGSQTVMLRFMGDTELEPPLADRYVGGMGGVVERASEYRNAPSAIGYSFRFFLTGLGGRPRIKMLAVDGVSPTPETIRSGAYPYVVNLYAISAKSNPNPHIGPFLEWMRGGQGQELVEKVGYVRAE
ncbi:MAG: substrate-binding domain-containing protein [Deltaproteobacteria bacterium]|nr:substrate-binding domain-containing protein [Deltaproteobacteria bacterium]